MIRERPKMWRYPCVLELQQDEALEPRHPLREVDEAHPIVGPLEYFLSLKGVAGFDQVRQEIIDRAQPNSTSNQGHRAWSSVMAELGATWIVGRALKMEITGFEATSPRAEGNRTCDIEAATESSGDPVYFEVKGNQKETSQKLPRDLRSAINRAAKPFAVSPRLKARGYDCSNLEELEESIQDHVAEFERQKQIGLAVGQNLPMRYKDDHVELFFYEERGFASWSVEPLSTADIRSQLLESGKKGREGTPMIPLVKQAEAKGADFLAYFVEPWGSFEEVVDECFETATQVARLRWMSNDDRLGTLSGVILFRHHEEFNIVENASARVHLPETEVS